MNQSTAAPTKKVTAAAGGSFVALVTALVAAGVEAHAALAAALVLTVLAMIPAYWVQERPGSVER